MTKERLRITLGVAFCLGILTAIGLTIADLRSASYIAFGFSFLIYIALFPSFWNNKGGS